MNVMPPLFTSFFVFPPVILRKNPLPAPFRRGIGIFAVEGHRQLLHRPHQSAKSLVHRLDPLLTSSLVMTTGSHVDLRARITLLRSPTCHGPTSHMPVTNDSAKSAWFCVEPADILLSSQMRG